MGNRTVADMSLEEVEALDPATRQAIGKLNGNRKAQITAPGLLGLPPALDRARILHGIPEHCFEVQPYDDRILIWQISTDRTDEEGNVFFGDTEFVMDQRTQAIRKNEAPWGILIGAGMIAQAKLESQGIHLGDTVVFLRAAPFRLRTGWQGTEESKVIIMQSGDLVGSKDLRGRLVAGEDEILRGEDKEGAYYYLKSAETKPNQDELPEDY